MITCFEKQESCSTIYEENSTLEISFEMLYPEIKGNNFKKQI